MDCPRCGTLNDARARFCQECGSSLAATCSSCGEPLPPGAKFCSSCGTPVGAAGAAGRGGAGTRTAGSDAATAGLAANQERRLVTVLFADLVGSTTLADGRDPEETRELLEGYFETCRQLVERYGGTVEKFIGDAVMAVWGTPVAHEDDAERAVRTALDLVEAVAALGTERGVALQARAGVLTGEAAVNLEAVGQGMVAGDMVNTAARLQGAAPPGTVLVGDRTQAASSAAIAYEPAGEQLLKGKQAPVAAYRALRVVARAGGAGRSEQLEPPFVGRQGELRMLKELFHAVGEERRPRLVSVIGQAGIGKSRLVWELQKYLDGVAEVAYWHQGRCPAYGEGVSFWALSEMVRERAGITEADTTAQAVERLAAMLEEFVPDAEERRWLEPAVRELLGLQVADGARPPATETLFAAWRTLFERIAAQGTAILIFEDLHWADPGLLDFIEHVIEWSRNHPIYIVTLARPELFHRRPGWGAGWRNLTSIGLDPLPEPVMRELLEGLVPGLPAQATERILSRAEGVPLYAVETVRMLLADGRLEPTEGGTYRPTRDLADLAVPETLHALVASRLDALSPALRTLVQEASVLGKTFPLEGLAAVSGRPAEDLAGPLRELVRRELLTVDVDPRSAERGQYGFVQSVIQEVAYGMLARRERRRLHLAAARYYESLGDEELAGVLAGHYLDAYRARPEGPEGSAVAAQARLALRAAADRASRLASRDLALRYLEQALEVARDDADLAELHLLAGRAAFDAGELVAAEHHLREATRLNGQLGLRRQELVATAWLALAGIAAGELERVMPSLEEAADRFADLEDTSEHVQLAEVMSRGYMRLADYPTALAWCERGLAAAARHGLTRLVLELLVNRATVVGAQGRLTEAVATLRGSLELAGAHGWSDLQARAYINFAFVAAYDDPRAAFDASRAGLDLAYRVGLRAFVPPLLGNATETGIQAGEWDVVVGLVEPALELNLEPSLTGVIRASRATLLAYRGEPYAEELARADTAAPRDDPQTRSGIDGTNAVIALAEGRYDEAQRLAWSSLAEFAPAVTPTSQACAGRAGLWTGDPEPARRAIAALGDLQGRLTAALQLELRAGIAALEGAADAGEMFLEALRAYSELELDFERSLCQISLVATLPSGGEVSAAADEARKVLTQLRARAFIERLDEVSRRRAPARPSTVSTAAGEQPAIGR